MISKEARERDRAICEAATTDWREGAVEKWHLYCAATHPERMAHERVLMRANENFPYEADVKAAAHCRNRLPDYIAALDEAERERAEVAADVLTLLDAYERGYDIPNDSALRDRLRAFAAGGQ